MNLLLWAFILLCLSFITVFHRSMRPFALKWDTLRSCPSTSLLPGAFPHESILIIIILIFRFTVGVSLEALYTEAGHTALQRPLIPGTHCTLTPPHTRDTLHSHAPSYPG
ncbi:hypothetical protein T492DRAFT_1090251, partial [Pavlovales sp. CCMP2436]